MNFTFNNYNLTFSKYFKITLLSYIIYLDFKRSSFGKSNWKEVKQYISFINYFKYQYLKKIYFYIL